VTRNPAQLRDEAYNKASELLKTLELPAGYALAATGSFARREMTPRSDIDLILLYPDGELLDEEKASQLWYPVWDAKYHLDYSMRTPSECAQIAAEDTSAGFAQLDLSYVAGDKMLVDEARAKILAAWRLQLQRHFEDFLAATISRWRRSGTLAAMTNPDIKNGRGGLRDIQLLRALALGNLCDAPDLSGPRRLLLDVRTLLHVHARRHRDTLDPEFAADIAANLGFADRYELSAALVSAAATVDKAVERGLSAARDLVGRRSHNTVRKPLDLDVVESRGYVTLARNADLADPALVLRVAAAAARTGKKIDPGVWGSLGSLPPLPEHWISSCTDAFFALLSFPTQTHRVIAQLDEHGLWEKIVPEWPHIRGMMPRERTHLHTIDFHSVLTVERCAEVRTHVARPDLLLLAALYHDIGKGYGRPHEQVGAEMVTKMAAKMRLNLADRSRVQTLVAEHTTLAKIVTRMDPASDEARDALLDAVHFDHLTVNLLKVLAKADAESTGPGVWNQRMERGIEVLTRRALRELQTFVPVRPRVHTEGEIGLRANAAEKELTIFWHGSYQREVIRVLALIAALGWSIVKVRMARVSADSEQGLDAGYAAEFDVRTAQESFAAAADEDRFVQAYKSGVYTVLPPIEGGAPATAMWNAGGVFEVRTPDRPYVFGHVLAKLPDCEWITVDNPGATMVLQAQPIGDVSRASVVRNVTQVLATG